jgi:hypothetical protein
LSRDEKQGIAAYQRACSDGMGSIDTNGRFQGLPLEDWRAAFYARSTADSQGTKQKQFARCRTGLQDHGLLQVSNDVYRITDPGTSIFESTYIDAARTAGQDRTSPGQVRTHNPDGPDTPL